MLKAYQLEDVETAAKLHPDSFFIPSRQERRNQKVGASVRVHFILKNAPIGQPKVERIWLTVTKECGFLTPYKGKLEVCPMYLSRYKLGDEITFRPCHIGQTLIKRGDPRWIDCADEFALVSKLCLQTRNGARWLYREQPSRAGDSGWRVFSGLEPDGYEGNPDNISLLKIGYLLSRDPTLLEPFKACFGSAFERDGLRKPWRKIEGWKSRPD